MPDRQYQFAILGAGALGSIYGAHLAKAGHSVAMLARGRRADYIEKNGLILTGLTETSVPVPVLRDPASLRSADVLIIATKTPGTEESLAKLRHVEVGSAFSVQNGTQKDDLLSAAFGPDRVLGSLADTSGEMLEDGRVLFTRNVATLVGELSGPMSARVTDIASMIDGAGVRTKAVPNILSLEWSKFVTWTGMFALAVLTRSVTWRYLGDPDSALLLVRMTKEMGRIAAKLGVELVDNANLPAAALTKGTEQEGLDILLKRAKVFETNSPDHRMSSLQDLLAGRPLEVHETLGYAVKKAGELGIPVPLLDSFYRVIAASERIREAQQPHGA